MIQDLLLNDIYHCYFFILSYVEQDIRDFLIKLSFEMEMFMYLYI